MVDFKDSPAEAEFRSEVQAFLEETKQFRADGKNPGAGFGPKSVDDDKLADYEGWRDALAARHWIAPHWPKEAGGAGLSSREQAVLNEEFSKAGVSNVGGFGTMMIGPTLLVHGSDEQKAEHLPEDHGGRGRRGVRAGRNRAQVPTSPRCRRARCATVTSTWSMGRRSGPLAPTRRTGCTCWRGAIPMRRSIEAFRS